MNILFHINERLRCSKARYRSQESDRHPSEKSLNATSRTTVKSPGSVDAVIHLTRHCEGPFMIYHMDESIPYMHSKCGCLFVCLFVSPALYFLPKPLQWIWVRISLASQVRQFQGGFFLPPLPPPPPTQTSSEVKPSNRVTSSPL